MCFYFKTFRWISCAVTTVYQSAPWPGGMYGISKVVILVLQDSDQKAGQGI